VALPLLDAMVPSFARAAATKSPTRMAFLYVPNGIVMDEWTPVTGEGVGEWAIPETLPRITSAIAPFRKDLMILSGLTCNGGRALGDGAGDHGRAGAAYLTATHPRKSAGKDVLTGTSVDQVAAKKMSGVTRFASLELGCEEGVQGGNATTGIAAPTATRSRGVRRPRRCRRKCGRAPHSNDCSAVWIWAPTRCAAVVRRCTRKAFSMA
jgi:hypothetical protein